MRRVIQVTTLSVACMIFVLSAVMAPTSAANVYDGNDSDEYAIFDNYRIDAKVNKDRTVDITETIDVDYKKPTSKLTRYFSLQVDYRDSDKTAKVPYFISDVKVSGAPYSTRYSDNDDMLWLDIGDGNTQMSGKHSYAITYKYDFKYDDFKGKDVLQLDDLFNYWYGTPAKKASFSILMPKQFNASGVYVDTLLFCDSGNHLSDGAKYSVSDSKITWYSTCQTDDLSRHIKITLPDGYFTREPDVLDLMRVNLWWIVSIVLLIPAVIAAIKWRKYGRNGLYTEVVQYMPPRNFNSLQIELIYRGHATYRGVTSLLIYLASKGYLTITIKKGFRDYSVTKNKAYDGRNNLEKVFMEGLFKNKDVITKADLRHGTDIHKMMTEVCWLENNSELARSIVDYNKKYKLQVFRTATIFYALAGVVLAVFSSSSGMVTLMSLIAIGLLSFAVLYPWCIVNSSSADERPNYMKIIIASTIIAIMYCPMLMVASIGAMRSDEELLLMMIPISLAAVSLLLVPIVATFLTKRSEDGNIKYGEVVGFKRFLATVEKARLEAMVDEDPSFFYNILPYTYVLGVSKIWLDKLAENTDNLNKWCRYSDDKALDTTDMAEFMQTTVGDLSGALPGQRARVRPYVRLAVSILSLVFLAVVLYIAATLIASRG